MILALKSFCISFSITGSKRTDGSQLLFERERDGVLLQGNPVLDDISVIGFQVTVFPRKDIRKLFH